jgi:DNA (cytosine-5)-methyltransferase 1
MNYGSVCSGIEAASVAWNSLGWKAEWLAEIERFPSEVLAHHYPDVPNLGDMTKISRQVLMGQVEAPAILVGGTPCQAFSIAGLREGLSDDRGQLTISYVRLFDAIDYIRGRAGKCASVAIWENVPGVLSSKDNAFGCFLGALAGEDCELQPPGKKWSNAGCVFGPTRTVAWRILDAQYFGVAQRRRRVFVIASARKDFDPVKVLFEFDGLRRDIAPSREAGQETAGTLASRTGAGGFPGTDEACSGYLQAFGGGNTSGSIDVATCLTTSGQRLDFDTETFAIQAGALRTNPNSGPDGVGVQGTIAYTLEARAEVQAVCVFDPCEMTSARNRSNPTPELSHTLPARAEAPVAYSVALRGREGGATAELGDDVAGCLRASTGGGDKPHVLSQVADTLTGSWHQSNGATGGNNPGLINPVMHGMAVRRLMPIERERLQAFPDSYTRVPIKKGAGWAADGPRYKALGNSMCVNVMAWIGSRIQQADEGLK